MLILDVGSGLTCSSPIHARTSEVIHVDILRNCVGLDCQASVLQLPFKDKTFDITYLSHMLEHVDEPLTALRESKRVSRNRVIIRVPNEVYTHCMSENSPNHIYSWTVSTLTRLLQKVFPKVHVEGFYRITQRHENSMVRRKLRTLKTYVIALFFQSQNISNELVAYCKVDA